MGKQPIFSDILPAQYFQKNATNSLPLPLMELGSAIIFHRPNDNLVVHLASHL